MDKLSEKTIKILEIVSGLVIGFVTWALLILTNRITDQLLQYSWLAWFALVMFGSRSIERKLNRPLKKFRMFLLISMGIGLVVFIFLAFVFKVL